MCLSAHTWALASHTVQFNKIAVLVPNRGYASVPLPTAVRTMSPQEIAAANVHTSIAEVRPDLFMVLRLPVPGAPRSPTAAAATGST